MKKLVFLFLGLLLSLCAYGAALNGVVKIDPEVFASKESFVGVENFGVFVFSEQTGSYDVTDSDGRFSLKNLEIGKEYTVVCQKKGIKDHKEKIKITKEEEKIVINIKAKTEYVKIIQEGETKTLNTTTEVVRYRPEKKFELKGRIESKNKEDNIYINFKNKGYGIVARPNEDFSARIEAGNYNVEIEQEGMHAENIELNVTKDVEMKTVALEGKKFGNINIEFENDGADKTLSLYKDERLKIYQSIIKGQKNIRITDLRQGNYKLVVKTIGYKEFSKNIALRENADVKVSSEEGIGIYDSKRIFFSVYPENTEVSMVLYDKNGKEIARQESIYDGYIGEVDEESAPYRAEFKALGYKNQNYESIEAGQRIQVFMEKEKDFIFISGTVHPFKENAKVELVGGSDRGKTATDKNGNYNIKIDSRETGRKIIRVFAEGYEEKFVNIDITDKKDVKNLNIELKPIYSSLAGTVKLKGGDSDGGAIVLIDGINMWTVTSETGEYSFPNIPAGNYEVVYKKIGYEEKREKVTIEKDFTRELNIEMKPICTLILKSEIADYEVEIETMQMEKQSKEKFKVGTRVTTRLISIGKKKITAKKEGYRPFIITAEFKTAGEEKEIKVVLEDVYSHKIEIDNRIEEVNRYTDNMDIEKADKLLYEIKRNNKQNMEDSISYSKDVNEAEKKLEKAKKRLYDGDNLVRKRIKEIKKAVSDAEESDVSYARKREIVDEKYKEAIDFTEKTLIEYYYTTLKMEIYNLQGDIYMKMGMINSAQSSYETAKKYK